MSEYLIYLVMGGISGFISGLFGIGGGLVITPILLLLFEYKGYSQQVTAQMAVATSLAVIIVNSASAAWNQHRRGAVSWREYALVPALTAGAMGGAIIADSLSGMMMRWMLVVFLIVMAAWMLQKSLRQDPAGSLRINRKSLSGAGCIQLAGLATGCLSAIVGIAGGTFLVPMLNALGYQMKVAIGTSSALGIALALSAATGYAVTGRDNPDLPGWTAGYIYLPAWLGIVLISPWTARFGVRLTHQIPQHTLRTAFAVFLLLVATQVLWKMYG